MFSRASFALRAYRRAPCGFVNSRISEPVRFQSTYEPTSQGPSSDEIPVSEKGKTTAQDTKNLDSAPTEEEVTSAAARKSLQDVKVDATHANRLQDYYDNTIAPALLYLTYDHELIANPPPPAESQRRQWDPENPYTKNRPERPKLGGGPLVPAARPVTGDNVVKLDHVTVSIYDPHSIPKDRSLMFDQIMTLQAITGQSEHKNYLARNSRLRYPHKGIQLVKARNKSARYKIRPGTPLGVKTTLKGVEMYDFCETLSEFVFPRITAWSGMHLPNPTKQESYSGAVAMSGTVTMDLPKESMPLFPQISINQDSYSTFFPMTINFTTDARGEGSAERARALLSGLLRMPFVRT